MPPSPQTAKLTSTLHLLIPRLRLLQKKDTASSVIQRRELANLLTENRLASARIRVENVIATDVAVEAMEMVELYAELLLARANVLDLVAFGEKGTRARGRAKEVWKRWNAKQTQQPSTSTSKEGSSGGGRGFSFLGRRTEPPVNATDTESPEESAYIDPALDEAATAIFYAYPRFPHDVRELTMLRSLLAERYGKEFMALASEDREELGARVPGRLVRALRVNPPAGELVERYLGEIARAYGVSFGDEVEGDVPSAPDTGTGTDTAPDTGNRGDDGDGGGGGGGGGDISTSTPTSTSKPNEHKHSHPHPDTEEEAVNRRRTSSTEELTSTRATPPRGFSDRPSPISVAPPGARSDNPNPRVKLPDSSSPSPSPGAGAGAGAEAGADAGAGAEPREKDEIGAPRGQGRRSSGKIPEVDELTRRFAALRR